QVLARSGEPEVHRGVSAAPAAARSVRRSQQPAHPVSAAEGRTARGIPAATVIVRRDARCGPRQTRATSITYPVSRDPHPASMSSANVTSISAVREFRAALVQFADEAASALDAMSGQI